MLFLSEDTEERCWEKKLFQWNKKKSFINFSISLISTAPKSSFPYRILTVTPYWLWRGCDPVRSLEFSCSTWVHFQKILFNVLFFFIAQVLPLTEKNVQSRGNLITWRIRERCCTDFPLRSTQFKVLKGQHKLVLLLSTCLIVEGREHAHGY